MTQKEYLIRQETKRFGTPEEGMAFWRQRYLKAKEARSLWDFDAMLCRNIMSNRILRQTENGVYDVVDKLYMDNQLRKDVNFRQSILLAQDIFYELKSKLGLDYLDISQEKLENLINFSMSEADALREDKDVVWEQQVQGYGVEYCPFDSGNISTFFRNGRPVYKSISPQAWWVDPSSVKEGWRDRRYSFQDISYDIETARHIFNDKELQADPADETRGDNDEREDMFTATLVQFKRTVTANMVEMITTYGGGQKFKELIFEEEYLDMLEQLTAMGKTVPDNITFETANPRTYEAWFQVYYGFGSNKVLSDIEYLGYHDHYAIFFGNRWEDDVYPRSDVFMQLAMQEIRTLLLTKLVIEATKTNEGKVLWEEGALINNDYAINGHRPDWTGEISAEWREQHYNQTPFTQMTPQLPPQMLILLSNMIKESQEETSGNIPIARGQAQYSGQSGVQTAQLQATASNNTKAIESAFRDFQKDKAEITMGHVIEYMDYEMYLPTVDANGQPAIMVVNEGNVSEFQDDLYYPEPIFENTPEVMKEMQKDRIIQLNGAGKVDDETMLSEVMDMNGQQVRHVIDKAMEQRGILGIEQLAQGDLGFLQALTQVGQKIKENPELLQKMMTLKPSEKKAV